MSKLTRRRLWQGFGAGAASLPLARSLSAAAAPGRQVTAKKAPAVLQGGSFTYWGGLIFSEEANNLLVEEIEKWGEENGIDVEVVMINQNETTQKVTAALESNTMPDALDIGLDLMLLLANSDQLEAVDDVFETIGAAHGGWFDSVATSAPPELTGGIRVGVPFGSSGNMLFSRTDVLAEAGLTPPPTTWQQLREWAEQAQQPPIYGMGFALSNVGDGNLQTSVLQSYGGRIADDTGKTVTLKSEETRTYLQWVSEAYAAGLFPPGATTWDGAGDNTAYLSGQAIFIANTGSVYLGMKDEDPELAEATSYSPLPEGPIGRISPINPNFRAIPKKDGGNVEMAKSLFEYLANPTFTEAYFNVAIYGPVLQNQKPYAIFSTPVHGALAALVEEGTAPGYPDVFNPAFAEFQTNFLVPKMIQRVVIDGYTLDEAMDEAQAAAEAIYAKYE